MTLAAFRSHLERGFWDFLLDDLDEPGRLRWLETLVTSDQKHWAHLSTFLVAEVGGTPAAALCGYFEAELGGPALGMAIAQTNAKHARSNELAAAGFERAGSIMKVVPEHEPGAWIVENVATLPAFRRRGLVDRLIAEILQAGRQRRAPRAEIGVFIGNDPAQRAYEKNGFTVSDERRDAEFEAVYRTPGIRTLTRPL